MTTTAKTAKATKTAESQPFAPFGFPTSTFDFPYAFRELAETSASQVRDTYARLKTAAEDATDLVEGTFETARKGAVAIGAKGLDAAKSNSDASFEFARDLFGAKTVSEMIELQSSFARKQFDALTEQFKEFQVLGEKFVTDTAKPVSDKVEKTMKELKVA